MNFPTMYESPPAALQLPNYFKGANATSCSSLPSEQRSAYSLLPIATPSLPPLNFAMEPMQIEPVRFEPVSVRPEPMRADPEQAEHVRDEPVRAEPTRAESLRVEPHRIEPVTAEPVRVEPNRIKPVRAESVRPKPVRVEPDRIKSVRAESVRPEPVRVEPDRIKSVRAESMRPEPVGVKPDRIPPIKAKSVRPKPVGVEHDRIAPVSVQSLSAECVPADATDDLIVTQESESQPLRDLTNQPPRPKKLKVGCGFVWAGVSTRTRSSAPPSSDPVEPSVPSARTTTVRKLRSTCRTDFAYDFTQLTK